MKTLLRIVAAGSFSLAALSLGGCSEGGPGPYGTNSEQNVGSRGSHDLNSPLQTSVPQPAPTQGAPSGNAADKAIESAQQPGGMGGTSQENAGSSTPGGVTATPGAGAPPNPTPAAPTANTSNANQPTNTVPINTGPGTTGNNSGYPNTGLNTNAAGQPVTGNNDNPSGVNGRTNNAATGAQPAGGGGAAGAGK